MRITDTRQIAAFGHPLRCRLLLACADEDRTLTQLACKLTAPLPKLHYHAVRLLDAGLLAVSHTEPRGGRPIRHYRAVAASFLLPHDSLAGLPGDGWTKELRQALRDERDSDGEPAVLYGANAEGDMFVRLIPPEEPRAPRSLELWRRLRLDSRQREALGRDLAGLLERYAQAEPGSGAEEYLAHAAFAPRPASQR